VLIIMSPCTMDHQVLQGQALPADDARVMPMTHPMTP